MFIYDTTKHKKKSTINKPFWQVVFESGMPETKYHLTSAPNTNKNKPSCSNMATYVDRRMKVAFRVALVAP
jgi:hypothetical protein